MSTPGLPLPTDAELPADATPILGKLPPLNVFPGRCRDSGGAPWVRPIKAGLYGPHGLFRLRAIYLTQGDQDLRAIAARDDARPPG
jgi:hypothetical protein